MKKFNIYSKSPDKIRKGKKNILIFGVMGAIALSFVFALYNGIDMEAAIKANNAANRQLEHPDMKVETEKIGNSKISWAIDMENTIDNLKEEQDAVVVKMAKETERQISASNAIVLSEIQKTNILLKGKVGELKDDNTNLRKQMEANIEKNKSQLNVLKNKIARNKQELLDNIENGVMLPPPPFGFGDTNNSNTDSNGLFSKINILGTNKNTTSDKKRPNRISRDFKIISHTNNFVEDNATLEKELTKEEILKNNTYEMVIGFSDGVLITGAYAPLFGGANAGGQSAQAVKSVPVLMESTGDLLMPNDTIGSIDKCFLLGIAEGNAGARSIDIRLDKMTCIIKGDKTKMLQGSIEGYVVSEAGTPGLPATMIYKAGDFIGRMIGAGVLEGLSTALVNWSSNIGNDGTNNSQYYGDVGTGASNGMSNAFTKLSDFYLQLAEATMPILEVKPGRFVTIVLTGGNKFELTEVNLLDVRDVESYIDNLVGE